jgi:hypothetical protein
LQNTGKCKEGKVVAVCAFLISSVGIFFFFFLPSTSRYGATLCMLSTVKIDGDVVTGMTAEGGVSTCGETVVQVKAETPGCR